jgi:hypothetical protein
MAENVDVLLSSVRKLLFVAHNVVEHFSEGGNKWQCEAFACMNKIAGAVHVHMSDNVRFAADSCWAQQCLAKEEITSQ